MKAASIILGALAAVATAAPTKVEPRGNDFSSFGLDFSGVNNFDFSNQDLQYLSLVNSLDFGILAQLSQLNGFNFNQFSGVFGQGSFDVSGLLQLQQLALVSQLGGLGLFNSFDLSSLVFNQLNAGLINDVFAFNLGGVINQAVIPQVVAVVQAGGVFIKE